MNGPVHPNGVWTRVGIDLDQGGNPVQATWDRYVGWSRIGFGTCDIEFGPFDPAPEVFAKAVAWCRSRGFHDDQLELPL